jgi:hypothetical protein
LLDKENPLKVLRRTHYREIQTLLPQKKKILLFISVFTLELLRVSWYGNSFAENLQFAAGCEATDPRDKIYGKLGLQSFSKLLINITPDYTKSLCEVLVDTSKAIIEDDPIELYGSFPMQPLQGENMTASSVIVGLPTWASALEGVMLV